MKEVEQKRLKILDLSKKGCCPVLGKKKSGAQHQMITI
jgi:hypothetical protein